LRTDVQIITITNAKILRFRTTDLLGLICERKLLL